MTDGSVARGPGNPEGVPRWVGAQGGSPVDWDLPLPEEPVQLRTRVRALVEQAPEQGAALIDSAGGRCSNRPA